ncbi:MAG: NAD(P)H-dependent oxidoreductase subunit E [Actinobacteria bacterium]|nr:NAD(P)H-dependent oxidoreductase subunit E [Actinomycetota bacterium]
MSGNGHGQVVPTPSGVQAVWMDTDMMGARETAAPELPAEFFETARRLIARYPEGHARSALLPLLYLAQAEQGYVSRTAIRQIAGLLELTPAEVTAVSTFYTMFKRTSQGKWLVSVCTQPSCYLAGGAALKERLEHELGIECGGTTEDGVVSLEDVECLCQCDGAPVFSVNYENYVNMTVDDAIALVSSLRAGGTPPAAASGDVPAPFDAVNRRMSGIEGPFPKGRTS